jgi:ribosomal protein L11 methyltransferase
LSHTWKIRFLAPEPVAESFGAALEPFVDAVAFFSGPDGDWIVEGYAVRSPDGGRMGAALALAATAAGVPEPVVSCIPVPDADWVAESRQSFQPTRTGRFFVYPSHFEETLPPGVAPICVDAATAFGSGEHESTRGCLLALDRLARQTRPRNCLDLGCGSGILSIAMARLWRGSVTAVDIDPESVRVSRANVRSNGVAAQVRVSEGPGLARLSARQEAPYDLIVANILARPLIAMAADIARHLRPGGVAILSGLLTRDAMAVSNVYRRCGLPLRQRLTLGAWATLILGGRGPGFQGWPGDIEQTQD